MTIYLDFQATTPLDPRVLQLMLPWYSAAFNPHASENEPGRRAHNAVEQARAQVAALLDAAPEDVVFTSGATEAANVVLRSLMPAGGSLALSAIEHPCVTETAQTLAAVGADVRTAVVDADGILDLDALEAALGDGVDLVSVMGVNNEVGTIQPIQDVFSIARAAGALYHCDAAQAVGRIPLRLGRDFDVATVSAHKVYGPQGIGAIVASADVRARLSPLATGGGQERGLRGGTLPVALAVGMGEAFSLAAAEMEDDARRASRAAELLLARLEQAGVEALVLGSTVDRVPHNLNVSFPGVLAEELLARTPQLALSTGSACSSGALEPSRVLTAMGVDRQIAAGAIRIGFGRTTTMDEVEAAAACLASAVAAARGRSRIGVSE